MTLTCSLFASVASADVTPGVADAAAASHSTVKYRHAHGASQTGATVRRDDLDYRSTAHSNSHDGSSSSQRYPGDLSFHGGAVVTNVVSHPIYLDPTGTCTVASCWGNPEGFLRDLGKSDFIHVIDQFVGVKGNNRYTVAAGVKTTGSTLLTDNDILAVVHAAAVASGQTGYGHQYHVFLAPGVTECFDASYTVCYSPNDYSTFYFCAYHSSVDFPDIGHVLYSVEPYQNVPGCRDTGAAPNGALIDSTNNVLSHELFETITDPDGDGWWNSANNGMYGQEIGDECSFLNQTGFDPSVFNVQNKSYAAQPEYSNHQHACTVSSSD